MPSEVLLNFSKTELKTQS